MKKKKITHDEIAAATKRFLDNGGKIQKLDIDNSGMDFKQRVNQAEIRVYSFINGRKKAFEIDPVPFSNKIGWRAH